MLMPVSGPSIKLLRVTAGAVFVVLMKTAPKARFVEESVTGALPVPERAMTCGLLGAVSETLRVAVRVPIADGSKEMLMVQEAPAARLDPQLFDCLKSPGSAPPPNTLLMVIAVERPLYKVTCCGPLTDATGCAAKVRGAGETVTAAHEGRLKFEMRVCHVGRSVPTSAVLKYWFTYQNVQSFEGSTVMLE